MTKGKRDTDESEAIRMMIELAEVQQKRYKHQSEWEILDHRAKFLQSELTKIGQRLARRAAAKGGGRG